MTEAEYAARLARIAAEKEAKEGREAKRASPVKKSKYNNRQVTTGDVTFPSQKEADRYVALLFLKNAGRIRDLRCQVAYELAPSVYLGGKRKKPALRYFADFVYVDVESGVKVVEDVKGMITPVYRIKKHLMATVHQILVHET